MEQITYSEKLALISTHERNKTLLGNLMKRPNPSKVEYLLEKYKLKSTHPETFVHAGSITIPVSSIQHPESIIHPPAASDKLRVIRTGRQVNYDELPPDLKRRWDENRDNYKLIRSLHEKLKLMHKAPDTMREPLCGEIVSRDAKIKDNWKVIDEWDGVCPTEGGEQKEPVELDYKRINSNRKYISFNLPKAVNDDTFREKVQERYNEMKAAGIEMKSETLAELKAAGINL